MSSCCSISREHLFGATVWAYGAGAASVVPWTHRDHFSRFGGESA
ncbi:hypothetical protein HSB1_06210 [Halogranum salarium B-1]|uniref:Uncharacterized protein n=1 Tax=Halogranum salarium B-1 TaxID=1210908 RepID=J2ZLF4_9EURY|nr:hypothetical protein HSB1_06210 [Halogranum salarium B-1]